MVNNLKGVKKSGILICLILIVTFPAKSQETNDTTITILNNLNVDLNRFNSLPQDNKLIFLVRNQTSDFFNTQLVLAEPSTISSKYFFLDKTFNSEAALQKKDFVLNADIQIPIGLGGPLWNIRKIGWLSTVQIIPHFKVRIFDNDNKMGDKSLPVRTPSYIPRLTYYGTHKSLWRIKAISHYWGISGYHHSNGQDGNEFNENGTVNIYNGNFGEQLVFDFIYGGLYTSNPVRYKIGRKGIKVKKRKPNKMIYYSEKVVHDIYWKVIYEYHSKSLTNKSFKDHSLYGRNRLNLQIGYIKAPIYITKVFSNTNSGEWHEITQQETKELFRFILNTNYILDNKYSNGDLNSTEQVTIINLQKRLNIYLTGYLRIRGTPYSALFLQAGYWGTDNYNIYFQQSLWQIRAGLALSFFKYPRN
ncbi:MAG: hypothetical protein HQ522_22705 [Bacteroidetes bacterium]|nr:hypothetical protein [Bacteroidota bacterium]